MPAFEVIEKSSGNYMVTGDLTFLALNRKTTKSFEFLKSANEICIDLLNVNSADSAGLALMIEWIKQSKLIGTKLTFKNIPQQLLTLARLSGFENNEYFTDTKLNNEDREKQPVL